MSIMKWNDSFSVGVPEIDEQHRKLFEMINILDRVISSGHGLDVLARLFSGLMTFAESNFRAEEEHMWYAAYPYGASHKQEHDEMTAKANDLARRLADGSRREVAIEVLDFLHRRLREHILVTDMRYAPYLSQAAQPVGALA